MLKSSFTIGLFNAKNCSDMKLSSKVLTTIAGTALCILGLSSLSQAALLFHEPFDFAAGTTIDGQMPTPRAGPFLNDEASNTSRGQRSTGEEMGISSIFSDNDSGIQAAYWDENTEDSTLFALNLSQNDVAGGEVARITLQKFRVIGPEFRLYNETVTTNVCDPNPYTVQTMADFNIGAATTTTSSNLDETLFDTIGLDAVRTNLEQICIATTFELLGAASLYSRRP
jgi:hypothetical protein